MSDVISLKLEILRNLKSIYCFRHTSLNAQIDTFGSIILHYKFINHIHEGVQSGTSIKLLVLQNLL